MNQALLYIAQLDAPGNQADGGALIDIINTALSVVGIISVIFVLIGGFRYVISAGDAQKISQAKDTILYALIGAVVAGSAFVIVNFLLGELAVSPESHQQERIVETVNDTEFQQVLSVFTPKVHAESHIEVCPDNVPSSEICNPSSSVADIAATVIRVLSFIVGAVAVVMIIVGGLRYVVSGGDQQAISDAKNMILYAVIGLVVAGLAQVIVTFVLNEL